MEEERKQKEAEKKRAEMAEKQKQLDEMARKQREREAEIEEKLRQQQGSGSTPSRDGPQKGTYVSHEFHQIVKLPQFFFKLVLIVMPKFSGCRNFGDGWDCPWISLCRISSF